MWGRAAGAAARWRRMTGGRLAGPSDQRLRGPGPSALWGPQGRPYVHPRTDRRDPPTEREEATMAAVTNERPPTATETPTDSGIPSGTEWTPDELHLRRHTVDKVLIAIGAVVAVVFAAAGGLLMWGSNFAEDYVHDELASQNVVVPRRRRAAGRGPGRPGRLRRRDRHDGRRGRGLRQLHRRSPAGDRRRADVLADRRPGRRPGRHRRPRCRGEPRGDRRAAGNRRRAPWAAGHAVPGRDAAGPAVDQLRLGDGR